MLAPLLSSALTKLPHTQHGFFTRQGGHSTGLYDSLNISVFKENTPHSALRNREEIATFFKLPPESLCFLRQVHGTKPLLISTPYAPLNPPEADALITTTPGLVLGIQTADCVPILLSNRGTPLIAGIHGGWKPLIGGIIQNTLRLMKGQVTEPLELTASIGPCISQVSYEVSQDIFEAFSDQNNEFEAFFQVGREPGKYQLDLPSLAQHLLTQEGIKDIDVLDVDTYADEERFFSCRRAAHKKEPSFGNQASCIVLTSSPAFNNQKSAQKKRSTVFSAP